MKFCQECGNVLYYIEKDKKLYFNCKKCGFSDESNDVVLLSLNYDNEVQDAKIDSNIVYDVSLARTSKIQCPNKKCKSRLANSKIDNKVVLYNNKNTMKLIHICYWCKSQWN